MDNPLKEQKKYYGEDKGPPMLFTLDASVAFKDGTDQAAASWNPPPPPKMNQVDASVAKEMAGMLQRQVYQRKHDIREGKVEVSPCELPGDFPPELAYRALAAYSLLRTLSVPLRLSPFTPNAFLRALYLPIPNKLLGSVHVALLRILLPHLQLGYSYKEHGGGVGVKKRRHYDHVTWPLRAGDNLTYLDAYTWPLFYDDYCHLTADRQWKSYHDEEMIYTEDMTDDTDTIIKTEKGKDNEPADPATGRPRKRGRPEKQQPIEKMEISEELRLVLEEDSDSDEDGDVEEAYEYNPNEAVDDSDPDEWKNPRKKRRRRSQKKQTKPRASSTEPNPPPIEAERIRGGGGESNQSQQQQQPSRRGLGMQTDGTSRRGRGKQLRKQQFGMRSGNNAVSAHASVQRTAAAAPQHLPETFQGHGATSSNRQTPLEVQRQQNLEQQQLLLQQMKQQQYRWQKQQWLLQQQHQMRGVKHAVAKTTAQPGGVPKHQVPPDPELQRKLWLKASSATKASRKYLKMRAASTAAPPTMEPQLNTNDHHQSTKEDNAHLSDLLQPTYKQDSSMEPRSNTNDHQNTTEDDAHKPELLPPTYMRDRMGKNTAPPLSTKKRLPAPYYVRKGIQPHVVSTEVAQALEEFITKGEISSECPGLNAGKNTGERDSDDILEEQSDDDDPFQSEMEKSYWVHFEPLERMRRGIPHHRLDLDQKLIVLEFLIDELLSMEEFASVFSYRNANCRAIESPYGPLPTPEQLDNMVNEDECGVCYEEGDLILCDGCVNSYHRECIGIGPDQELGEGKWLCPECQYVDPSKFGPLDGGHKSSVDWFCVGDLPLSSQNPDSEKELESETHPLTDKNTQKEISNEDGDMEFLVIHGYVFCRKRSGNDKGENQSASGDSDGAPLTMKREKVQELLSGIGMTLSRSWPLSQIPRSGNALANDHLVSTTQYFEWTSSVDPCLYENKYRNAPVTILTKAGGVNQVTRLQQLTYENECHRFTTWKVSEALTQDVSLDANIGGLLKVSSHLFDPYQACIGYMVALEAVLSRACMLNSRWDEGQLITRGEEWISRVKAAKSVPGLAKLLGRLVDEIHPRAFEDGWRQNPNAKQSGVEEPVPVSNFQALPDDWTIESEKLLRGWQTTPPSMILRVCSDDGKDLEAFASQIETAFSLKKPAIIVRSKRTTKVANAEDPNEDATKNNEPDSEEDFTLAEESTISDTPSKGVRRKPPPSKRRSTRRSVTVSEIESDKKSRRGKRARSTAHTFGGMSLQIDNAKKQKLRGLRKLAKGPCFREGTWPIAGRRVFPTMGSLSRPEVKRLGRKAGVVVSPHLTYDAKLEVAQVSYGHIWRKRMSSCSKFEDFLFLIRILESSLDRDCIHSCELASKKKRAKSGSKTAIHGSRRNPDSGTLEHFVVNQKTMKGCWIPDSRLDAATLILPLHQKRLLRLQEKREEEKRIAKLERERRLQAEKEKKKQIEEERKKTEKRMAELEQEKRRAEIVKRQKELDEALKRTRLSGYAMPGSVFDTRHQCSLASRPTIVEPRPIYEPRQGNQMEAAIRPIFEPRHEANLLNGARDPASLMAGAEMFSREMAQWRKTALIVPFRADRPAAETYQVEVLHQDLKSIICRHAEKMRQLVVKVMKLGRSSVPEADGFALRRETMNDIDKMEMKLLKMKDPITITDKATQVMLDCEQWAVDSVNKLHNASMNQAIAPRQQSQTAATQSLYQHELQKHLQQRTKNAPSTSLDPMQSWLHSFRTGQSISQQPPTFPSQYHAASTSTSQGQQPLFHGWAPFAPTPSPHPGQQPPLPGAHVQSIPFGQNAPWPSQSATEQTMKDLASSIASFARIHRQKPRGQSTSEPSCERPRPQNNMPGPDGGTYL